MKRPTRRQLDGLLASGRLACESQSEASDLDDALFVARTYIVSKRDIPSHVIMRCIAHARHWKGRDIPPAIVEARKVWLRMRDSKRLAERLGP